MSARKTVGYWAVTEGFGDASCVGWILPQRLQSPGWMAREREAIVAYLRGGALWARYMGQSTCRFPECGQRVGSQEFTDGVWVWPEGLAHYVDEHHVRLPRAFLDTMASHRFAVPPDVGVDAPEATDGEFWLTWCARQVSPRPPLPGAVTLQEAQALASALSVEGCTMSVDVFHDQWLVRTRLAFGTLVDLIPPCSTQVLSLHLHRWRHVPSSLAIDPREMKHILAEVFPPSPWWTRLAGTLRPGGDPRPTLTTSPSGLILRIGSGGRGVTPTDATGWRHRLSLITVGEPERSASQHLVQALGLRD